MKTILRGNEAIEAYNELQGSYPSDKMPKYCGYFCTDDCDFTSGNYDRGAFLAFDSYDGLVYEDVFGNKQSAVEWLNL